MMREVNLMGSETEIRWESRGAICVNMENENEGSPRGPSI